MSQIAAIRWVNIGIFGSIDGPTLTNGVGSTSFCSSVQRNASGHHWSDVILIIVVDYFIKRLSFIGNMFLLVFLIQKNLTPLNIIRGDILLESTVPNRYYHSVSWFMFNRIWDLIGQPRDTTWLLDFSVYMINSLYVIKHLQQLNIKLTRCIQKLFM